MFDWFKRKKKWALVKSFSLEIYFIHEPDKKGQMWFYLYEADNGSRREERRVANLKASDSPDNLPYYNEVVYPWLNGVNFKNIPSYWDTIKKQRPDDIKRMYKRFWK